MCTFMESILITGINKHEYNKLEVLKFLEQALYFSDNVSNLI